MALDLVKFIRLRPHLYHLTARENIPYIQKEMVLKSSNTLYGEANATELRGIRRANHQILKTGRRTRDQRPLHAGNISFSGGWTLTDLVLHLDDHVFFWPGWEYGPISYGKNHFDRYAEEKPIILRVSTKELFAENPGAPPLFCKYNSGAPRCTYGEGSPRGPQTFLGAGEFQFSTSEVREVTFRTRVALPQSVQAVAYPRSNWQPLIKYEC
jgi:hypothetical protein